MGERNFWRVVHKQMNMIVFAVDTVGRLGGDEFIILQPTNTGRQGAADVAARISKAVAEPFFCSSKTYQLGCSSLQVIPRDDRI
jgi:GGDEF domain-containing protein